ncbi:MAG TPA: ABC transporter permease [Ilumatobacter sp.]|nr:ABC transporter permease [Ilumatobacter sp.]
MKRRPRHLRSRLSIRDLVGEATAAITRRPGRSLLTALGTVAGVAAFVATTGLATTAQAQVGSSFDALKATEVTVIDNDPDGTNPFPTDTTGRLTRLNGVNHAGRWWTIDNDTLDARPIATPTAPQPSDIPVIAADPDALRAARPELSNGVIFDAWHDEHAEPVAVLGRQAADRLGITRIDNQPAVFIHNTGYTVVGIINTVARNHGLLSAVIVPAGTATTHLPTSEQTSYLVLVDVDAGAADLIGSQAADALRPDNPDRLQPLVPPDPRQLREQIEGDVTTLLYGLAGLALLVGMIGIANTTLVAVMERRNEIGVRRALGARRHHIATQFLTESATLGALGGVLGTSLGVLTVVAVAASRDWTTTLDPLYTLPAPAVGLVAGLVAGLQPAWRASRITPATALRSQ